MIDKSSQIYTGILGK